MDEVTDEEYYAALAYVILDNAEEIADSPVGDELSEKYNDEVLKIVRRNRRNADV